MDEIKDILNDFLDRIDRISANSATGQSSTGSTVESSARDSVSQKSAEQRQETSLIVQRANPGRGAKTSFKLSTAMCCLLCQTLDSFVYLCTSGAYVINLGGIICC